MLQGNFQQPGNPLIILQMADADTALKINRLGTKGYGALGQGVE